ncbi:MAG: SDR family oxidoreductase [Deltaproteobacteria bacterium]|nr:SDR family oxidoreductase [Candidatus Anaeroferrophillus wilburensis]MBN2889807.1 SDR family oxidoreductase [Deltaproteobacteria bacterium]
MVDIPTTVKNKGLVEKRRRQIVLAAIKLFAKNGFHKTTLKELAAEANLSYGNIYDYVGSKEDIFFLIHDFLAGSAMDIINRSIENIQDPIDKLRRMVRAEFNLMDQWADALLLIYQESHILKGDFLRKLLQKERQHLGKFEKVIAECVAAGRLNDCDLRLTANLIKSMIDSWVIKRWDLRNHVNQLDAERMILEIIFNGLSRDKQALAALPQTFDDLQGKTVLVLNGGTVLGQAICSAFLANGGRLIVHGHNWNGGDGKPGNGSGQSCCAPVYVMDGQVQLTPAKMQDIEDQYGPIDIYIHDLGMGMESESAAGVGGQAMSALDDNMRHAHDLANYLRERMSARRAGRIVYLAPWAWDRYADAVRFETAKAGAIALSQVMSKDMAAAGVNVNCIVPGYIRASRPLKIEKAFKSEVAEEIPSGRLGELFDVIAAVFFLIGDGSKYLTGQVFNVTGGLT